MKSLLIVVNVDWFFLSHRLPIALAALEKGYRVTIVSADSGRRREIEGYGLEFIEVPFERSGINPLHELACVLKLVRLYKVHQSAIIHHVTLKASLLGSLAAKLTGRKTVVNAISGLGYSFTDGRKGLIPLLVKAMVTRVFKSHHFRFILQNPDDVALISTLNLVPDDNIYLIKGSGVELHRFCFTPITNEGKIRFLFPARILADKGVFELLEAAKILQEKYYTKAEFILAGDCDMDNPTGIDENRLKGMIDGDYIQWTGFHKDVFSLLQQASVVVLPSYREGLPKSLIEACAVGRAIVTTDVPGCRECVDNHNNGLMVPAKDAEELAKACEYFILNPNKIVEYGANSRKKAEKEFSIDHVIEKTLSVYNDIHLNHKA